VKLADEDLQEVSTIKTNQPANKAVVEYTTTYKNITPFSSLTATNFNKNATHKAYFSLNGDGWKLEKKPGSDFLELEK